jgi:L-seryl-tRNA(Ser) seleniumtransferase
VRCCAKSARRIGDRTAAILRVHPSNFRIEGFTERPALDELAALARRFNIALIEDIGSGWLGPLPPPAALRDEPAPRASLAAGADLVLFSGDKLLGGPQAGIIAGREPLVTAIRRHPLMRALRVDKLTYAALEATLQEYAAGRADATVPVARMIAMHPDDIGGRAGRILRQLPVELSPVLIDGTSTIGGGSAPGSALPTRLLSIAHARLPAAELARRLREADPPVIARVEHDRVLVDLRTVAPADDEALAALLSAAGR